MSETLNGVGSALENVSRTSHTSAEVLSQVRDNINARDGQLERILLRQNTRFTTMLAIAIFLSVAALVAVNALAKNVRDSVAAQSQALLGADLRFASGRPLPDSAARVVDSVLALPGAEGATGVTSEMCSTAAVSFEWEVVGCGMVCAGCGLTTAIRYLA